MTDLLFADPSGTALPLTLVTTDQVDGWRDTLDPVASGWVSARGFRGAHGTLIVWPGPEGLPAGAAVGMGDAADRRRHRFALAAARGRLPKGVWRLDGPLPDGIDMECLGWLLDGYRFDRYAEQRAPGAMLEAPAGVDRTRVETFAAGEVLTRDLINTPANDMGPAELAGAVTALADDFGARVTVTTGQALLDADLPMIHTVGAASTRAPRLIDMTWGDSGPALTLVGKGVCFDTGGLNLKPGGSMALMKKDMGGAATVIGLARTIMALGMPVRLRVLIPAVENSVAGAAFRPGDILRSRKGLSVEINNTDAEGRLVLADALALADEDTPDLVVSMATLTGAARVALGPDLAPFFTDDDAAAAALGTAGQQMRDPVWRLPFWDPYEPMIEPGIADLDNAPKGGFAGAVTAALFLRRFVTASPRYLHFDIYGWQPKPAPGRPFGGAGQGARALVHALPRILDL